MSKVRRNVEADIYAGWAINRLWLIQALRGLQARPPEARWLPAIVPGDEQELWDYTRSGTCALALLSIQCGSPYVRDDNAFVYAKTGLPQDMADVVFQGWRSSWRSANNVLQYDPGATSCPDQEPGDIADYLQTAHDLLEAAR